MDAHSTDLVLVSLSPLGPLDLAPDRGCFVCTCQTALLFLLELALGGVARDMLLQPCTLARAPGRILHSAIQVQGEC